jgi:hypothetical protein
MIGASYQKGILEPIAHHLGINPRQDMLVEDVASWTAFANLNLQTFLESWPWPEWTITEERAFRPVWNAGDQYHKATADAAADEFYYLTTPGYYRVKAAAPSDPPAGTQPTNATYFEPFTLTDRYIATKQRCRRELGEVLGVYPGNPRTTCGGGGSVRRGLPYRPSEKGIDVCTGLDTVWVHHKLIPPVFSAELYEPQRVYQRGEVVFWAADGEVYRSRKPADFYQDPASGYWYKISFPGFAAQYVIFKSASDACDDAAKAAKLEAMAEAALGREIDKRQAQGQRFTYQITAGVRPGVAYGLSGWFYSCFPLWGVDVPATTLTSACVDEFGVSMTLPTVISGSPGPSALPFDLPCVIGQNYVDVIFALLPNGYDLQLGYEIEDDKFEYIGVGGEANVFGRPLITERTTSGFRALTDASFGADAADYRYRGKIAGVAL